MALALPPFVVLSNGTGNYLRPVVGDSQAETYGSLQFTGDDVFDLSAKYEVEASHDGLVHIRCCCNNKYWARRAENDDRIVAKSTEPEIDSSKWSCTLFKPIINGVAQTVRFHHIQLDGYVTVMPSSEIAVSLTEPGVECVFIDWGSLVMLPKHVAFRGSNRRYLIARQIKQSITDRHNYMQFKGKEIGDQTVRNDVFVTADGYVRIKSHSNSHFWRRDPRGNWIWADSSDNDTAGNDLFWPVKIRDNVLALRSRGNNFYCKRSNKNYGRIKCLKASAHGVINEAHLEMEETILSRSINVVRFRLADISERFNDFEACVSDDITNDSSAESFQELKLSYSKTRRCTWSNSAAFRLGVKTTIRATIPSSLEARLDISGEISETINWGEERENTEITERTHKVTVPPNTIMRVTVMATVGIFEVPFSYIQSDILTNGNPVSYLHNDGVYKHENCLGFKQRNTERRIIRN